MNKYKNDQFGHTKLVIQTINKPPEMGVCFI